MRYVLLALLMVAGSAVLLVQVATAGHTGAALLVFGLLWFSGRFLRSRFVVRR